MDFHIPEFYFKVIGKMIIVLQNQLCVFFITRFVSTFLPFF